MSSRITPAKATSLQRKSLKVIENILDEYVRWEPEYNTDGMVTNLSSRPQGTVAIAAARTGLDEAEKALAAHQAENPAATAEVIESLSEAELQAIIQAEEKEASK